MIKGGIRLQLEAASVSYTWNCLEPVKKIIINKNWSQKINPLAQFERRKSPIQSLACRRPIPKAKSVTLMTPDYAINKT